MVNYGYNHFIVFYLVISLLLFLKSRYFDRSKNHDVGRRLNPFSAPIELSIQMEECIESEKISRL